MKKHEIRTFETGATRDNNNDKFDYESFLSPLVIRRFGEYMHQHRKQSDGSMREADNWQLGIPIKEYVKSAWRHFLDMWSAYRNNETDEEALCALLFNIQGYLHEHLKNKNANK